MPDVSVRAFSGDSVDRYFLSSIRRVLDTADYRCRLLAEAPGVKDIAVQAALRSVVLERSTSRKEKHAIRTLCSVALAARTTANVAGRLMRPVDAFPPTLQVPDWVARLDWDEVHRLDRFLEIHSIDQLREIGWKTLSELSRRFGGSGFATTSVDTAIRLAGVRYGRINGVARIPPKADWEPITEPMVRQIDITLAAMPDTARNSRLGRSLATDISLPRLLMRAAWLTGMRASELFSCRLLAFRIDPPRHGDWMEQSSSRAEGVRADEEAVRMQPVADVIGGKTVQKGPDDDAPSLVLFIRSAKVECTSLRLRCRWRMQLLDGLPGPDLEAIRLVSRLRLLELDREGRRHVIDACSEAIKRAAREALPERRDRITLNTFRHAFIDQARLTMPLAEVAALTGHTAIRGVHRYGRRYARFRADRRSPRWMPEPDPRRVAEISRVWADCRPLPEPVQEPEPVPELDFEPSWN